MLVKILLVDLETAPNQAYVWAHYDQNVIQHVREWNIMAVAYKWLGEKGAQVATLPDFDLWHHDHHNDQFLVERLWDLLDEADVVVAHNGDRFDLRKANARFLFHGMTPPSPYKTVDTLKIARRHFRFNQNGLDPLSEHLGLGRKAKHEGFQLWKRCMEYPADVAAWNKMVRYAKQDVVLLEKLYLRLRPWAPTHPTVTTDLDSDRPLCPTCGSDRVQKRGQRHSRTMTYQQYHCQDCGAWSRERLADRTAPRPELVQ